MINQKVALGRRINNKFENSDENLVVTCVHPHSYFVSFLHAVFKESIGMGISVHFIVAGSPLHFL